MNYSPDLFLTMMTVISMRKDAFIITINMLTEAIMEGTTTLLASVGIWVAGCIYRKNISFKQEHKIFWDNLLFSVTL